jgi:hypothetical protein
VIAALRYAARPFCIERLDDRRCCTRFRRSLPCGASSCDLAARGAAGCAPRDVITRHLLGQAGLKADVSSASSATSCRRRVAQGSHQRLVVRSRPKRRWALEPVGRKHPQMAECRYPRQAASWQRDLEANASYYDHLVTRQSNPWQNWIAPNLLLTSTGSRPGAVLHRWLLKASVPLACAALDLAEARFGNTRAGAGEKPARGSPST